MLRIAVAAAALLLALGGCEERRTAAGRCPAGKLCLDFGNTAEPATLDPAKSTGTWEDQIISDMLVGLVTDDASGKPIPGMALSWTTSPDGLTWTFKLRHALWSDGVPVTADDFVFSLRRLQDPKTASEYSYLTYVIKNAQAVNGGKLPPEQLGVRALDTRTLEIKLEHPAAYLPQLLKHATTYPTPAHVVRRLGDAWVRPGAYVSNGPFTLRAWDLGDKIHVVKNPRFYDARNVCLDEVFYYPTIDRVSAERRVRGGELDVNSDITSRRVGYLQRPGQMPGYVHLSTYLGTTYMAFNTNLPKLKDRRVRQALAMAVDRDFITGQVRRAGEKPAYAFVPPGIANYPGGVKPYWAGWSLEQRRAEARRLLRAAGYGPDNPLKVQITQRGIEQTYVYPAVQADWRQVGVQATIVSMEAQVAYAAFRARDFEVADAAWIADFNDALNFLELNESSTGAQNYGDYKNPAYDAFLAQSAHEPDVGKRAQLLMKAEQTVLDDAPIAPLFYLVTKNLVNPAITGWRDNIIDHHRLRWVCFKDADARRRGAR